MDARRDSSSRYVRQVKARHALIVTILGASVVLVVVLGIVFGSRFSDSLAGAGGFASKRNVLSLWKNGKYDESYQACLQSLDRKPVDSFFLLYGGFSAFYAGISKIDDEEKRILLESSISWIRKAQLKRNVPMKGESAYILGKAYYHLGYFNLDQSIFYLERARSLGYLGDDVDEYLGMGYLNIGRLDPSIQAFSRALAQRKTDQLFIAAASALYKAGQNANAVAHLKESIRITEDILTEEKARMMIGEIMISDKRYGEAEEQYRSILEKDSESADAHYGLGLVHEARGDVVQARSEWRKAVKIDPMHQASRIKLSQK